MSKLSAALNQRKSGMLQSDTVQNLDNDGSCMAITIRSGKVLPVPSVDKNVLAELVDDEPNEECPVESEKMDNADDASEKGKKKEMEVVLETLPRPPPPFPQ